MNIYTNSLRSFLGLSALFASMIFAQSSSWTNGPAVGVGVNFSGCSKVNRSGWSTNEQILSCKQVRVGNISNQPWLANYGIKSGGLLPIRNVFIAPQNWDAGLTKVIDFGSFSGFCESIKKQCADTLFSMFEDEKVLKNYVPFRVVSVKSPDGALHKSLIQGYYDAMSVAPRRGQISGKIYVLPQALRATMGKNKFSFADSPYRFAFEGDANQSMVFALDQSIVKNNPAIATRTVKAVKDAVTLGETLYRSGPLFYSLYFYRSDYAKVELYTERPATMSFRNIDDHQFQKLFDALGGNISLKKWLEEEAEACFRGESTFGDEICELIFEATSKNVFILAGPNRWNLDLEDLVFESPNIAKLSGVDGPMLKSMVKFAVYELPNGKLLIIVHSSNQYDYYTMNEQRFKNLKFVGAGQNEYGYLANRENLKWDAFTLTERGISDRPKDLSKAEEIIRRVNEALKKYIKSKSE